MSRSFITAVVGLGLLGCGEITVAEPSPDRCTVDQDCNEGSACRTGACDNQTCSYTLLPNTCFIDGTCYLSGDRNPSNPCQSCQPDLVPLEWVNVLCGGGQTCNPQTGECSGGPDVPPDAGADVPATPDVGPDTVEPEDTVEPVDTVPPEDVVTLEDVVTIDDVVPPEDMVVPPEDVVVPPEDVLTVEDPGGPVDICTQEGRECGTAADGTYCGDCPCPGCAPNETLCSPSGQCLAEGKLNGAFCGANADCPATVPDPANPGQEMPNPDFNTCLHDQCASKFCLGAATPGVFINMPVCSRPCDIVADTVNNKTGAPGADGIEDPDVPFSDCDGFADGPGGTDYACVNFGDPGGPQLAYCLPGTHFAECSSNADCPEDEGCSFTTIGGQFHERCYRKVQPGDEYNVALLGGSCNENDPFSSPDGKVTFCDAGWCFGMGCVYYCSEDADCDTTQLYPGTGCDIGTGECQGWPGKPCTADIDCSAWWCGNQDTVLFAEVPEYTADLCWPKGCDFDDDCAPGYYCRFNWNGAFDEVTGQPVWDHICMPQVPDGVDLGEECDEDPDDNVPGDTCKNEAMCISGYCSTLCDEAADCGADQDCVVQEFQVDGDGDGGADSSLLIEWCVTFMGSLTPCWAEATCGPSERCERYQYYSWIDDGAGGQIPDPDGPILAGGKCVTADPMKGQTGTACMGGQDCKSGWCLGADPDANQPGFCTEMCEHPSDCPVLNFPDGSTANPVCTNLLIGWGADYQSVETNVYVALCQFTMASGMDCQGDFTCPAGEACSPWVVGPSPDYDAHVDYLCMDNTNDDGSVGNLANGAVCDPTLETPEGWPVYQCASGLCLEESDSGVGYCSALCTPAAPGDPDPCPTTLGGTPDMVCDEFVSVPRKGKYADNAGGWFMCRKDIDCAPCAHSGQCPGERVCVNLGQDADTLADHRCVPPCDPANGDADCAGEVASTCNEGQDAFGAPTYGCFEQGPSFPINYCLN